LKYITVLKKIRQEKGHFPFGKCGLKLLKSGINGLRVLSLPVWEVWIEILMGRNQTLAIGVTSRLGSVD